MQNITHTLSQMVQKIAHTLSQMVQKMTHTLSQIDGAENNQGLSRVGSPLARRNDPIQPVSREKPLTLPLLTRVISDHHLTRAARFCQPPGSIRGSDHDHPPKDLKKKAPPVRIRGTVQQQNGAEHNAQTVYRISTESCRTQRTPCYRIPAGWCTLTAHTAGVSLQCRLNSAYCQYSAGEIAWLTEVCYNEY